MSQKYYVSLYFNKEFSFAATDKLISIAEECRSESFGTPKTGMPSLANSQDPGDMAFRFGGLERAIDFTKKVLDLECILSARVGLYR